MAGKSTFLRQNAIIIILAQTGLFVPAEKAEIGLVDKIFQELVRPIILARTINIYGRDDGNSFNIE